MTTIRTVDHVLPVTTLYTFRADRNTTIVLFAQGNKLCCALPSQPIKPLHQCLDLPWPHAIHGLVPTSDLDPSNQQDVDFLAFGGRFGSWVRLTIERPQSSTVAVKLSHINSIELADWILCGIPFLAKTCGILCLTSYNSLLSIALDKEKSSISSQLITSEFSTFLYSGVVRVLDDVTVLVASGTALGEILIWTCTYHTTSQAWHVTPINVYHGHKGSIFGLDLVKLGIDQDGLQSLLLASCSDDRSINVWNLLLRVGCEWNEKPTSLNSKENALERFVEGEQSLIHVWAHMSRIWHVNLIPRRTADQKIKSLVLSSGEDGQVQSWELTDSITKMRPANPALTSKSHDKHHNGKNIWSRHVLADMNLCIFFTGGADGAIIRRSFAQDGSTSSNSTFRTQQFQNLTPQNLDVSNTHGKTAVGHHVLKSYMLIGNDAIIASTEKGTLLSGFLSEQDILWRICWLPPKETSLVMSSIRGERDCFIFDVSSRCLLYMDMANNICSRVTSSLEGVVSSLTCVCTDLETPVGTQKCLLITYYGGKMPQLLWILSGLECQSVATVTGMDLAESFEISCALYDRSASRILCGSRNGSVAIFDGVSPSTSCISPSEIRSRVHSTDTVTSIHRLTQDNASHSRKAIYLTTGRDNTYSCLSVTDTRGESYETRSVSYLVHRATPPIGQNIEGACIVQQKGLSRLLLYGFRSKDFIVWDETLQTQVMRVDCGGSHRNWDFFYDHDQDACQFVWTQARAFMFYKQSGVDHEIIKAGAHGREIKAMAITRRSEDSFLIATGSEDTDIKLFSFHRGVEQRDALQSVSVIRKHTTGLQDLCFLDNGDTLISAGGMEELYAWRLSPLPILGQGVVLSAAATYNEGLSDARIMGIATRSVPNPAFNSHQIGAALSSGKIRLYNYNTPPGETQSILEMTTEIDIGTVCLTQIALSDTFSGHILVGATNGSLIFSSYSSSRKESLQIHQNAILAFKHLRITDTFDLVICSGDDNAISLTITSSKQIPNFSDGASIVIPKAHAAAVTALDAFMLHSGINEIRYLVFSASNDQSVCIWSVTIDIARLSIAKVGKLGEEAYESAGLSQCLDVRFITEAYASIADISSVTVIDSLTNAAYGSRFIVAIAGVGVEILKFDIELPSRFEHSCCTVRQ